MRILIVDDLYDARLVLRYMVENNGHEAIEAENGWHALTIAKCSPPDLIISDALMPVMDGFKFLRALKQDHDLCAIPFILYSSAYTKEQDVRLAMSLGANACLFKPMDPVELWEKIKDILGKAKHTKENPIELIQEDAEYLREYSEVVATKLLEKVLELEKALAERKRAEEAAKKREEEFRAIANYTYDWESWIAPDGSLVWVNPAIEKFTGYSPEEWLSRPDPLSHVLLKEDQALVLALHEKALNERLSGNDVPFRVRHKDGSIRWAAISYQPIYAANGNFLGLRTSVRDITERKHTEELVAKLGLLKDRLINNQRLSEKQKLITDEVVAIFGADFARMWMIGEGDLCEKNCLHAETTEGPDACRDRTSCLHLVASSGRYTHINGKHQRVPFGCYKIGRVASGEDARFVTNDVSHDSRIHDHEWAQALGLVSFAGFRLHSVEGKPIGVLALFSKQTLTSIEEELIAELADYLSLAILADRAREALLASETKFRTLFENANDAIFLWKKDKLVDCNARTLQMFQCSRDQIIGHSPYRLSPPLQPDGRDSKKKALAKIDAALAGKPQFFLWRHCLYDGTPFDAEVSLNSVKIGDELFLQAIVRDISERKQAEEALQKSFEEIHTLRGIIPICANCKKIRDDQGYWNQVEVYLRDRTEARFSHGICPECMQKLYPDYYAGR